MADLPALVRALDGVRAAAPPGAHLDLTHAGEFDIGPAWFLYRTLEELSAAGRAATIEGQPPAHFAYFDELPAPRAGHRGRRTAAATGG